MRRGWKHGTISGYNNCKCERCTKAIRDYRRARRAEGKESYPTLTWVITDPVTAMKVQQRVIALGTWPAEYVRSLVLTDLGLLERTP